MNIANIDTSIIEQSKITVSYPFVYDTLKLKTIDIKNLIKFKNEYLKDFLPYTKNFFGNYHFKEDDTYDISSPLVIKNTNIINMTFFKDNKIKNFIDIDNLKFYFFEKSIAILTITYNLPIKISSEDYLLYHHKLTTIEKRSKQNLKTSQDKEYKYYFEFIYDLISPYCQNNQNIFTRSYLYSYNLIVAKEINNDMQISNFIEPLLQYRTKLDTISQDKLNANYIQQVSNIYTIANENVVLHMGIKSDSIENNFIEKEFFNKYQNNHFLTYLISLYQTSKIEQLIIKAFLQEDTNKDLSTIRDIKAEILHFIANGNFTRISNNSIRNSLYKFYRNNFEIEDLIKEIDTISDKISNQLETIVQDKKAQSDEKRNLIIGIIGVILAGIQIYQAF